MNATGPLILAIDQGTTNTKAILVDAAGQIVARASAGLSVAYPQPSWVEQDAEAIWQSVQRVVNEVLSTAPTPPVAVGVSNQRESVVLWERATGKPLAPCVVWQCQRGNALIESLRQPGVDAEVHRRTGLTLDPMFSASKMHWLLDNTPGARRRAEQGELCLGTVDSWLLFKLTGGRVHACDMTNAARTLLFNLHTLNWDNDLLEVFDIPRQALPVVQPSTGVFALTATCGALPAGIPIAALIGDSHGALVGHAGFAPGAVKATYGTGSSVMTPVATPILSQRGLSTTIAWSQAGQTTYALEGNIYSTGATIQWLGKLFGWQDAAATVTELAAACPDSEGVYLAPAFVGLGAPWWNARARGMIYGLTLGSGAAQLARAALESIAYQIYDIFAAVQEEAGIPLTTLHADGGASANPLLMQFQADLVQCPVRASTSTDVSALGAAYLAGLGVGVWNSTEELAGLPRGEQSYTPTMDAAQRSKLLTGWRDTLARLLCE
ncbi:MAG TPA: glycerol kinase GlpK [Chloroflexi bacterium]|nr:glycerol kinase GlpK [Chloroflexota bacterium]